MRSIQAFVTAMAAALLATVLVAVPSRAGDLAAVEVLGFSADGSVFAFEEYGVQDGSGFPYAHRFYINTANDKFLAGTPIRVLIEDEFATVQNARATARARGEKIMKDATLTANRGHLAGFNAVTELNADPYRMIVNPRPVFSPVDAPLEFRLEEFQVEAPARCDGFGDIAGFRLLKMRPVPGGKIELRHEDATIPLSRGCPQGYRLGGIQTFFPQTGKAAYAVLIAIQRFGFEGPDFRWIAATGRI